MAGVFRCTPLRCGLTLDGHAALRPARRLRRATAVNVARSTELPWMSRSIGRRFYGKNSRESDISASLAQETSKTVVFEAPDVHRTLKPSILRPFLFTIACGLGTYGLAAYLTNVDSKKQEDKVRESSSSIFRRSVTSVELAMARRSELIAEAKAFLRRHLGERPDINSAKTRIYTIVTEWWINNTEAQRTCLALIGVQAIVYLGWKTLLVGEAIVRSLALIPSVCLRLTVGSGIALLTSTFSHSSGAHFLFNSIAFYSFGPTAMAYLWQPNREPGSDLKESTSKYHFLALFATAGVISALFSHTYSLLYMLPKALMGSRSAAILPSLGASGSIYATVVVTALAYPDNQISLIIFPFASFPIGGGVAALVAFDVIGLLSARFRMLIARNLGIMLDHAGHLGGAACGWFAFHFGGPFFDSMRRLLGAQPKPKKDTVIALRR